MIVHGGSIVERHPTIPGKFYNTSVLIDRRGEMVAQYRKIHLFDVQLANGEKHLESERIVPGDRVVTAEVDGITFGLSVCYDLRFPELYRALVLQGAQVCWFRLVSRCTRVEITGKCCCERGPLRICAMLLRQGRWVVSSQ